MGRRLRRRQVRSFRGRCRPNYDNNNNNNHKYDVILFSPPKNKENNNNTTNNSDKDNDISTFFRLQQHQQ